MWKPFSLLPAIISVAAVVDHRPQLPAQRGVHALERGGALQCQPFQRAQTRVLILISIAISYTFCSRVPRQYGQIDDLVAIFVGLDLQLGGFGFQPGYPGFQFDIFRPQRVELAVDGLGDLADRAEPVEQLRFERSNTLIDDEQQRLVRLRLPLAFALFTLPLLASPLALGSRWLREIRPSNV